MGTSKLLGGQPDKMLGGNLRWTSIPSRGTRNTPSRFILQKPEISVGTDGPSGSRNNDRRQTVALTSPEDFLYHFWTQTIQEQHVKHLLENSPEDHLKAYRVLETLPDQQMSLAICESLLSQKLRVGQKLFIIQFMLTTLPSLLSPVRIERLLCTKMGAKALLCLPEAARPNYEDLVSRPLLLLEQLLMNMKVEWAAKVFQRIQVVC